MEKVAKHKHIIIVVSAILLASLLIFTACGSSTSSADSTGTHKVLVVEIDYKAEASDVSDTTQIENALAGGGMMILNPDELDATFKDTVSAFGASNAEGSYFVFGALMNYFASRGWELVQAPGSGLSDTYYFVQ